MIRVIGINLLIYINWICDDILYIRFFSLKKRRVNGEGVERVREKEREGN